MLRSVGIAKEGPCPEDPKGVDTHVALTPHDARRLIDKGCDVFVESGAGSRLGFNDAMYQQIGACIQGGPAIYRDKDLIVRIKGPTEESIERMSSGSTLFCMAHLPMYPERKKALQEGNINVVAMEDVCEHPFQINYTELTAKTFARRIFQTMLARLPVEERNVVVVGYSPNTDGVIRYFGRKNMNTLTVVPSTTTVDVLAGSLTKSSVVLLDTKELPESALLKSRLHDRDVQAFDIAGFSPPLAEKVISRFYPEGKLPDYGARSIQCLHETGRAGAQFGMESLRRDPGAPKNTFCAEVQVLGYGNVALGAIDQCLREGARVHVLGRCNTAPGRIESWLKKADLVINGALIPAERAGIEYVITNDHVAHVMRKGTTLIDLIGGSPTDRSPVESVDTCTFLSDPVFERDGIHIASVFAWPNYFRPKETCLRYSDQIASVLTREQGLIYGVENSAPGIRRALVLGPFKGRQNGA